MPKTMFEKIWEAHEVRENLLYIDLHLVHEVTSPQAFEGLRMSGRKLRRPDKTVATADHNVPTDGTPAAAMIKDALSRKQVETLEQNAADFGVPVYSLGSETQGIVHVIGPNAPWVEVWESPQTMVMPGWVRPSSGPITWTMPWVSEPRL